ncbi:MAG: hypothetical protein H8E40_06430 [Chloroflexi bacterium]|nr:hypothetical protein [Chloroflexota bacterium]
MAEEDSEAKGDGMNKKKGLRWDIVWPWIEPAVSVVVGVILYFPLNRPDLAEITWIAGFLLAFGSLATTMRLREEFSAVRKLSEILDISEKCNVAEIGDILRLYVMVNEEELRPLREDVIASTISRLRKLAHDKVSEAIEGSEYYMWLIDTMRKSRKGVHVYAVSVMLESTWVGVPSEKTLLEANVEAAKRGVSVERVFISSRNRLRDRRNREAILRHIEHARYGLTAYVVWYEDIEARDPELLRKVGQGFILFGDRVMLVDTCVPPEGASGYVSMDPHDLKSYRSMFEQLRIQATTASRELFEGLDGNSKEEE